MGVLVVCARWKHGTIQFMFREDLLVNDLDEVSVILLDFLHHCD